MSEIKHTWSKYQETFFNKLTNSKSNLVVQATPGSSKSTILVEGAKRINPTAKVLFVAFNKSIVEELQKKLPARVKCSTLHAMGNSALYAKFKHLKLTESKTLIFVNYRIKKWNIEKKFEDAYKFKICRIVELMRLNLVEDMCGIDDLIDHYDLDFMEPNYQTHIQEVWQDIKKYNLQPATEKDPKMVDFCDMVHLPTQLEGVKVFQYDYVMCDESQDFSKAQHLLIEKFVKPNTGRTIFVGDPFQGIYSFASADSQSFKILTEKPNTEVLPLPISYRCPRKVVELANQIHNTIEVWEKAEEGVVREGKLEEIKGECFVICRTNRPLIMLYYHLISNGVNCEFKNRQIIEPVLKFVNGFVGSSQASAKAVMDAKTAQIKADLKAKGIKKPTKHKKFIQYQEKAQITKFLFDKFGSFERIVIQLKQAMNKKDGTVQLMTVHFSKGLESERVFIIMPESLGLIEADMNEWEKEAEKNCHYVAVTRSKKELIFIPEEEFSV